MSGINAIRYYNVRIRFDKGLDDIILVLVDGYKIIVLNLCIVAKVLENTY